MTIEEKRRELFEAWYSKRTGGFMPSFFDGEYDWSDAQPCWLAFSAALDAVVIELPSTRTMLASCEYVRGIREYGEAVRHAIESTGLGLKVKP